MLSLRTVMTAPHPVRPQDGEALVLFSVEGTLLRATVAAQALLAQTPALEGELRKLVRAHRRTRDIVRPAAEITVGGHAFLVRVVYIEAALLGTEATILVTLEPAARHQQDIDALRSSFGFTNREAEVALLLLTRRSNLEIAEHLGISRHTARHHVQAVLLKLNVRSRVTARQLLARAREARSGA
jgi:DNA-binding CsgD family transcriptional regulator